MAAGICRFERKISTYVGALRVCWRSFGSFEAVKNQSESNHLNYAHYDWNITRHDSKSFRDLHVSAEVVEILNTQWNISVPTAVQRRSLPLALNRKSCLIQSPTGSGKTLCYLIPAIQDPRPGLTTLILVPTRELAQQVYHCASNLVARKKSKSNNLQLLVTGHFEEVEDFYDPLEKEENDNHLENDAESTDSANIVIGTPKRVLEEIENKTLDCQHLRRVVLDECDKLFLSGEGKRGGWRRQQVRSKHPRPVSIILSAIRDQFREQPPQLICTSATAEKGVREELAKLEWKTYLRDVILSASRQIPDSIRHSYVSLRARDSTVFPADEIAKLIKQTGEFSSSLLFIHRGGSIDHVVHQLRKSGVRTVAIHEKSHQPGEFSDFLDMFRKGEIQLAVGTEESVRGLDFPWVRTVYLTEVPRFVEEYVHLCGRVGRLNQEGQAVVVSSNPGKDLSRLLRYYQMLGVEGSEICLSDSPKQE